ncbi:translocation/assembly module TamB domain-containing protein [uncultured Ilyobacter sp.]|uniref:translocation/assembly module TamB domain-containing protein n=1 Tax=uncultured Ilyobacter sp. TaxID=544433 RepID=UPI002AA8C134|nr:translocation/assembly module TamB domain-containing protein [uncultured Ilyobacter sp.]
MKDLLRKYHKVFAAFVVVILIMISYSLYTTVRYSLPQTVRSILLKAVGPDIEMNSIEFREFGRIEASGVTLKDGEELILSAPKVEVRYSLRRIIRGRIDSIDVENPKIWISRDKDNNINIVKAFSKKSKDTKPSNSKAGTGVPIDIITVRGGELLYRDTAYESPIEKTVYNVKGYVSFHKSKGINLDFGGNIDEEKYRFLFDNNDKRYSLGIKLNDVSINNNLMQYAYNSEKLSYLSGVVNLDLTLEPGSFTGSGDFRNASVTYEGLNGTPENISGNVSFNGDKIYINSDYDFDGEKGQFLLSLVRGVGLDLDFYFKDVDYAFLEKYDLLRKQKFPLEGTEFDLVHVNLNFNSDYKLAVNVDFKSPKYTFKNLKAEEIQGIFRYEDEKFYFDDINFLGYFENTAFPINGKVDLECVLDREGGKLQYKISDIKSKSNLKNSSGNAYFDFGNKKIDFDMDSNLISFKGDVDIRKKLLSIMQDSEDTLEVTVEERDYSNKSNLEIIYDYGEKTFLLGKGNINIKTGEHEVTADIFAIKDNFKISSLVYTKGDTEITGDGQINVKTMRYSLNFATVNMDISSFIKVPELRLKGDYRGSIEGQNLEFQGDINVKNLNGKYFAEFNNLEGDIYVKYDGKLKGYFKGYLDKLSYLDTSFYDFQFDGSLENDFLTIKEFGNNILTIQGGYNIIESKVDFQYKISELSNKKLNFLHVDFNADKIQGNVKGPLSNVSAEAFLDGVTVKMQRGENLKLSGKVEFNDKTVKFQNLKVNENILNGTYKTDEKIYSLKLNLFEENLPGYYGDINLKYRVMGEVYIWGYDDNIRSYGKVSADRVYLRGKRFPNAYLEGSFLGKTGKELGKNGRLDLNKVVLLNDAGEDIIEATAYYDLNNRYLDVESSEKKLDLSRTSYLFPYTNEEGIMDLDFKVYGPIDKLLYKVDLSGDSINISDIKLDNIRLNLTGDLEKFYLNKFSLDYLGNNLSAEGNLKFKPFNYDFNILSSEIDLKLLNLFLVSSGVEKIEGRSKIDIHLDNEKNKGRFYVENLRAEIPKYGIIIQDVNSDIRLDNDQVFIESFKGDVNNGEVSLNGYLKIPNFDEIGEDFDPMTSLDYSLSLKMDKVRYDYQNVIKLILSSDAVFRKNKITGNFVLERGEVTGIPEVSNEDIDDLKSRVSVAQNELVYTSQELGSDFSIADTGENNLEIDIDFTIKEGVFIKLDKVATLVENLEAVIKGGGKFTLKDRKSQFLGQIESQDAEITINNNLFEIDRAVAIFDKKDEYIPDVNPTLLVSARSTISNEEVYIGVSGEYKSMDLTLSSSSGLPQEDIAALLAFHKTSDSSGTSNVMVKNILDSQISKQLFSPVSNEIQKVLRISKFKISSDIVAYDETEENYQESADLGFGASIEAENPIYKDKVFWNAKARIADTQYGDTLDEYDLVLEHRFAKSFSWGLGVGKLPQGSLNKDEDEQSNLNYHIDFKFRKTYDSLLDIFRKK